MHHLQFEQFSSETETENRAKLFKELDYFTNLLNDKAYDQDTAISSWNLCTSLIEEFQNDLEKYVRENNRKSSQFHYWPTFLDHIISVLRNLTLSHREGNWTLYMISLRQAMPLFFSFNHINYSRWAPLFFEDCIALEKKIPNISEWELCCSSLNAKK